MVLPLLWATNNLTFSKTKAAGFLAAKILAISKKRVPRASSKPLRLPIMLKG